MLDQLITDLPAGPISLARIVSATGSAPGAVGTAMLVNASGAVSGALSGGCVDAAVVDTAQQVLATGEALTEEFGVDESGWLGVGLLCGGTIEVFVERVEPSRLAMLTRLRDAIRAGVPASLATTLSATPQWHLVSGHLVTAGPKPGRSRSWLGLDLDIDDLLAAGRSGIVGFADCDDRDGKSRRPRTLVQTFAPPRRLILVGANDFVRELAVLGKQLGMRVSVVDARPVFATAARFPAADEVVVDWPDRYLRREIGAGRIGASTAVCVMTHDTKFDVPALTVALRSAVPLGFVGALGSRRTHDDRLRRLHEAGLSDSELATLHSPVGLDLGGHTPAEAAVSIAAEIIAERTHATGRPLHALTGPIHRTPGPLVQV